MKCCSDYFAGLDDRDIRMIDICRQIMDVCVVPIKLVNNIKFLNIWTDILEYSVLDKES